jgi:hypothetical protein
MKNGLYAPIKRPVKVDRSVSNVFNLMNNPFYSDRFNWINITAYSIHNSEVPAEPSNGRDAIPLF